MSALFYIPVVLSLAVLGAHFLRHGIHIGVIAALALIVLLFLRRPWVARLTQAALALGALEWARTIYELVQMRVAHDAPFVRMAIILGTVATVSAVSALLFQTKTMKRIYGLERDDQDGLR
ncbi:MAG: hypothetical protein GWN47_08675 [Woeseiaceae bacterium]|nr:hypothetical protein [Woeseiaceae bacterium]